MAEACPGCGRSFKTKAALSTHRKFTHPPPPVPIQQLWRDLLYADRAEYGAARERFNAAVDRLSKVA